MSYAGRNLFSAYMRVPFYHDILLESTVAYRITSDRATWLPVSRIFLAQPRLFSPIYQNHPEPIEINTPCCNCRGLKDCNNLRKLHLKNFFSGPNKKLAFILAEWEMFKSEQHTVLIRPRNVM